MLYLNFEEQITSEKNSEIEKDFQPIIEYLTSNKLKLVFFNLNDLFYDKTPLILFDEIHLELFLNLKRKYLKDDIIKYLENKLITKECSEHIDIVACNNTLLSKNAAKELLNSFKDTDDYLYLDKHYENLKNSLPRGKKFNHFKKIK